MKESVGVCSALSDSVWGAGAALSVSEQRSLSLIESHRGTQGGLNCLTHVLPRCLPTPTEEADGNGYGVIAGRGWSLEAAAQSKR